MTLFEKKQPKHVFVHAGKTAYKMLINFNENPYKEEPFRTLWAKGYMSEMRKFKAHRVGGGKRLSHA